MFSLLLPLFPFLLQHLFVNANFAVPYDLLVRGIQTKKLTLLLAFYVLTLLFWFFNILHLPLVVDFRLKFYLWHQDDYSMN